MKVKDIISTAIALATVSGMLVCPVHAESLALDSGSYYNIYESGESAQFTLTGDATVTVTDYFGNTVNLGSFASGAVVTPSTDTVGSYTITATSGESSVSQRFAVMPKLSERRDSSDTPVAFASMATHTDGKKDNIDGYMRTIKLAGVNYVREFMPADNTINGVGDYDFTAMGTNYHKLCDLMDAYAENDIGVLFMYNNMVKNSAAIEENMYLVYDYTKYICELFEGKLDAIEILNETEGSGTAKTDGPEKYAAAVKAAALGAKDAGTGVKVVSASFNANGNEQYAKVFAQNGTRDYYDIYNGHYYDNYTAGKSIVEYPADPAEYVEVSNKYGSGSKPLWMTEFGFRIPFEEGKTDLTEEQVKQQARTTPAAIVTDLAAGADKVFWFLHGYINEYKKAYGDFDSTFKPNPAYSAISALIDALGNARYAGKIEGLQNNVRAYVFKEGSESVLAIWSENAATVNVTAQNATLTNIMGNSQTFGGGTLIVGPDIQYIRATGDITVDSLKTENGARAKKAEVTSKIEDNDRIVLLPDFPEGSDTVAKNAYQLSSENEVGLTIYNFNSTPKRVAIKAQSDGGWGISNPEQSIVVPAMSNKRITFAVSKTDAVQNQVKSHLMFGGTVDGKAVSDSIAVVKSMEHITGTAIDFTSKIGFITIDQDWTQMYSSTNAVMTDKGKQSDGSRGLEYDFTSVAAGERKNGGVYIAYGGSLGSKNLDLSGCKGFAFSVKADRAIGDIGTRIWVTDADGDTFYTHSNLNYDNIQSMVSINVDSDSYRQAVFDLSVMGDSNTAGDGVLDLSKIASVAVGFSMFETQNGAEITSEGQIDTDKFVLYVKDIIALPVAGFGNNAEDSVEATVTYTDNKVTTTLSGEAKSVRHTINGVDYEAELSGTTAVCPVILQAGVYNVTTTVYDSKNAPHVFNSVITVDRTGENFIYYHADGATNVPTVQIKKQGETATVSSLVPKKSFCEFVGWTTDPTSETAEYAPGASYSADSDLNLYAVWSNRSGSTINELFYRNVALMSTEDLYMTVKGSEKELAGQTTTVIAYKVTEANGGSADSAMPQDIVYLNEVKASDNGNYVFSFPYTEAGEYRYSVRVGDTLKNGTFEEVSFGPMWADAASSLSISGKNVSYSVKVMNHAPKALNYGVSLSTFAADGRAKSINWNEAAGNTGLSEGTFEATLSEDYKTLKLMILAKDTASPLTNAVTINN